MGKHSGKVDKFSPISPADRRELTKNLIRLSTERRQDRGSSQDSKTARADPERR